MAKIRYFVRFSKVFLAIFVRFSNVSIVLPLPVSPLSGENTVLLIVNYCGYYLDLHRFGGDRCLVTAKLETL